MFTCFPKWFTKSNHFCQTKTTPIHIIMYIVNMNVFQNGSAVLCKKQTILPTLEDKLLPHLNTKLC